MTPQSRPIATILTRPQAQGDRFAAALAARFGDRLAIVSSPLIAPVFLFPPVPDRPYAALVLTSETGAQSAAQIKTLPPLAFCVGDRTAAAARSLGLAARSAGGDARDLVAMILKSGILGPLLHLRGTDTKGDVAASLSAAGLATDEVVTYDQRPQPPTQTARALLDGTAPVLLPLFSPRTATLLADHGPFRAPLLVAALSPAVAQAAAPLAPLRQATADAPNADALLTAISTIIDMPSA